MRVFFALLGKEILETIREKRLAAFAFGYTLVFGLLSFFILADLRSHIGRLRIGGTIPDLFDLAFPLYALDLMALFVLAAAFVFDAVAKERDQGMLALLRMSSGSPTALLAAKACLGAIAYGAAMVLGLTMASLLGRVTGQALPDAVLAFYLGPLALLWAYSLGTGLLLSVWAPNARLAMAVGVGINLPLLVAGATPVLDPLLQMAPPVQTFVEWTPFAIALDGADAILYGEPTPWAGYAVLVGLAAASLVAAFWLFRRQEVSS